jgi:hypothetical protein
VLYAHLPKMFELNLPKADVKLTNRNGKPAIWDFVRKKWLQLTPEEYVRQHFIHYLVAHLGYPASMISIEKGLEVNRLSRRSDIVIYNQARQPFILVECKAPQVRLSKDTLEQASAYNLSFKAQYLCVTNGLEHAFFQIDFEKNEFKQLDVLPKHITTI